jgi:hypothetical protein
VDLCARRERRKVGGSFARQERGLTPQETDMSPLPAASRRIAFTAAARACACAPLLLLAACVSAPTTRSGALTSYEGLAPSNGLQTKSQLRVNRDALLAAKTVRIAPTRFDAGVGAELTEAHRALVANRIDRALCRRLSGRLDVVDPETSADLSVQATITHVDQTGRVASGASVVASFVNPVPMVSPRVPLGLGSLTVEAEALDPAGRQEAAIVWSRKAQPIAMMGGATVSEVGDAYQFAGAFGENFGDLVTTGQTPFGRAPRPKLPKLGGKRDEACEAYGRGPGVAGFLAENLGLPPAWTDKGARKPAASIAPADRTAP